MLEQHLDHLLLRTLGGILTLDEQQRVFLGDALEFVVEQVVHHLVELLLLVFLVEHLVQPLEPLVAVRRGLFEFGARHAAVREREPHVLPERVFGHVVEKCLVVE